MKMQIYQNSDKSQGDEEPQRDNDPRVMKNAQTGQCQDTPSTDKEPAPKNCGSQSSAVGGCDGQCFKFRAGRIRRIRRILLKL